MVISYTTTEKVNCQKQDFCFKNELKMKLLLFENDKRNKFFLKSKKCFSYYIYVCIYIYSN